jgi:hypothetical protein
MSEQVNEVQICMPLFPHCLPDNLRDYVYEID